MNPQWFELRAFLSNSLVQVVFTPVCALFLFGAFWQNPKLHQQVWGIAWLKVLVVTAVRLKKQRSQEMPVLTDFR
ncbi:hypothetical protein [Endozoicomonas sp.]